MPVIPVRNCGLPGWSYAVAGHTAKLARSTPGATLTSLGADRYGVTFPTSVNKCACPATAGTTTNRWWTAITKTQEVGHHADFTPGGRNGGRRLHRAGHARRRGRRVRVPIGSGGT